LENSNAYKETLTSTVVTDAARALALADVNCRTDAVARLYRADARAAVIAVIGRLVGRGKEPVVLKSRNIGETDLRHLLADLERLTAD
jgi:hypothetical protein